MKSPRPQVELPAFIYWTNINHTKYNSQSDNGFPSRSVCGNKNWLQVIDTKYGFFLEWIKLKLVKFGRSNWSDSQRREFHFVRKDYLRSKFIVNKETTLNHMTVLNLCKVKHRICEGQKKRDKKNKTLHSKKKRGLQCPVKLTRHNECGKEHDKNKTNRPTVPVKCTHRQ